MSAERECLLAWTGNVIISISYCSMSADLEELIIDYR